mmetsp:Transcript_6244/g.22986  ORF Transcript_6244/g.22986 Transcript_6244/m.22986 type:complete len:472 (+) Transcript_6244:253-1668(+)
MQAALGSARAVSHNIRRCHRPGDAPYVPAKVGNLRSRCLSPQIPGCCRKSSRFSTFTAGQRGRASVAARVLACGASSGASVEDDSHSPFVDATSASSSRTDDAHCSSTSIALFSSLSFDNAFASFLFALKEVQQTALKLRSQLSDNFSNSQLRSMQAIQEETQTAFLWIFQRVFASTPRLMLSVLSTSMLTLVSFTTADALEMPIDYGCGYEAAAAYLPTNNVVLDAAAATGLGLMTSASGRVVKAVESPSTEQMEGESRDNRKGCSEELSSEGMAPLDVGGSIRGSSKRKQLCWGEQGPRDSAGLLDVLFMRSMSLATEGSDVRNSSSDSSSSKSSRSSAEAASLDRTDIHYQLAIQQSPHDALFLCNYAQFLYTVRHDAARAESAFLRAVKADPSDAEALGRYAMFLWLERGDWGAAEALFRAAVEVDPDNPWRAGSYARFLWDAEIDVSECLGDGEEEEESYGTHRTT